MRMIVSTWRIPESLFLGDHILEWSLSLSVIIYDLVMQGHDSSADAMMAVAEIDECCWAAIGSGGIGGPVAAAESDEW